MSCASTVRQRNQPERHVGQRLGQHPADPDHDAAAELRVRVHPCHQLPVAVDHPCDEEIALAVLRSSRGEELVRDVAHRFVAGDPEAHQCAFGLVRDPRTVELDRDREADVVGHRGGFARVGDATVRDDRDAVARDEL